MWGVWGTLYCYLSHSILLVSWGGTETVRVRLPYTVPSSMKKLPQSNDGVQSSNRATSKEKRARPVSSVKQYWPKENMPSQCASLQASKEANGNSLAASTWSMAAGASTSSTTQATTAAAAAVVAAIVVATAVCGLVVGVAMILIMGVLFVCV